MQYIYVDLIYEEKYELINLEIWLKSKRKILLNFVEILSYYPYILID